MDEPSLSLHTSCGLVEPCCLSRSILEFHNHSDTIMLALPHCHYTHTHTHTVFWPPSCLGGLSQRAGGDIFKVIHSNPVPLTHTRLMTATRLMRGNDTSAFSRNNMQPWQESCRVKRTSANKEHFFQLWHSWYSTHEAPVMNLHLCEGHNERFCPICVRSPWWKWSYYKDLTLIKGIFYHFFPFFFFFLNPSSVYHIYSMCDYSR